MSVNTELTTSYKQAFGIGYENAPQRIGEDIRLMTTATCVLWGESIKTDTLPSYKFLGKLIVGLLFITAPSILVKVAIVNFNLSKFLCEISTNYNNETMKLYNGTSLKYLSKAKDKPDSSELKTNSKTNTPRVYPKRVKIDSVQSKKNEDHDSSIQSQKKIRLVEKLVVAQKVFKNNYRAKIFFSLAGVPKRLGSISLYGYQVITAIDPFPKIGNLAGQFRLVRCVMGAREVAQYTLSNVLSRCLRCK